MPSTVPKHVLIIGGGLAGPCLALSLARRNIRSTIYEIRSTRGDSGGSLSVGPNGLRVLDKYAGIYDRVRSAGYLYSSLGAYSDTGEKFGDITTGQIEPGADATPNVYPTLRILRPTLHKTLLDAVEEKDGDLIRVRWGMKISRFEEDSQGVTAHFEDGSEDRGDILIGADGIHSKLRELILGDKAPASIFDNRYIISGFVKASSVIKPDNASDFTLPAFMFTPSGMLMAIPVDPKGETLSFGINKFTDQERTREGWLEFQTSGEAARLAKADYDDVTTEPVRSMLDNSLDGEAKLWAPYYIPDIPTWHTKRVCLLGDAAHALPPNGLGSGLAFEDTAILTRLLTAEDDTVVTQKEKVDEDHFERLFARFERIRRPRIEGVRKEKVASAITTKTGAWVWCIKKTAFRLFFWCKGGKLEHLVEYDVDAIDLA